MAYMDAVRIAQAFHVPAVGKLMLSAGRRTARLYGLHCKSAHYQAISKFGSGIHIALEDLGRTRKRIHEVVMEKAVCKIVNLFLSKGICNHPVRCRRNLCNEVCISGSRHILRSLCSNLRVEDHSIRGAAAEGLLVSILGD